MYFYCIENEDIVKYNISINEDKLKKLRSEIIEKCSEIKHIEGITNFPPNKYDYDHIKNYSENFVRRVHKDDFYGTVYDEYFVKYDYYDHPILINYIDKLLIGDTSIIYEIKNPKIKNIDEEKILMDEQKQIIEILNNKKDSNITKQLELLKENQEKLKQYKSKKVLNEIQVPVEPYYLKVFNCINFKEIARICLKSVLNLQEFLLDGNSKTIDTDLNKVLKLTIQQKINS